MLDLYIDIYATLCQQRLKSTARAELISLRKKAFAEAKGGPIVKVAFDTRRIDQENDYNPRRNLQTYTRSEAFIDDELSARVKSIFRVKNAVDSLHDDYRGEPEWLDSNARILQGTVDRTLRIHEQDMEFFRPQIDYVEELLDVRYRLKLADAMTLTELELRNLILAKDDKLRHKSLFNNYAGYNPKNTKTAVEIAPGIVKNNDLIEQLFGNVRASRDNPEVERTITITIKDRHVEPVIKNSDDSR
jgi:hypothetical protein